LPVFDADPSICYAPLRKMDSALTETSDAHRENAGYQAAVPESERPTPDTRHPAPYSFQRWHWLLIPLLAFIAYAPALVVGFHSDDWQLLDRAMVAGIDPGTFLPNPYWPSYRPVGALITWQIGWQLFGANPLPYHLLSLLLHAATALALGLWAATVTRREWLGWLAGAIFAVFPLHLEALAWTAAQWDIWAALFGTLSLWTFALWWSRQSAERHPTLTPQSSALSPRIALYLLSVFLFTLGLFSKESLLTFLPMLAISAWLVKSPARGRDWLRLGLWLLPFVGVLLLNVGIRFAVLGRLGGYVETRADIGNFLWTNFAAHIRLLLSPLAELTLGGIASQVAGAIASILLLAGLIFFGREQRRFLVGTLAWTVLAIVPVLNLVPNPLDLQQNRLLYLPAAGFCAFVAALLYEAIKAAGKWRPFALVATALLFILGVVTSWAQITPWHTATAISEDVGNKLHSLIPPRPDSPQPATWYVENVPDTYRGAYLFRVGLGPMRHLRDGDLTVVESVPSAQSVDFASATGDAFAIRFGYDPFARRYRVAYAAGVTGESPPPSTGQLGTSPVLWDFQNCDSQTLSAWQTANAQLECEPGNGLQVSPTNTDPQLVTTLDYPVDSGTVSFVRLRVMASYGPSPSIEPLISEWFWRGEGTSFSGDNRRSIPIRIDSKPYVYWTYIPATDIGPTLTGLRFDPINAQVPASIAWIALDSVPMGSPAP
jgi:hypothetical protein